jgi:hypothetical protein
MAGNAVGIGQSKLENIDPHADTRGFLLSACAEIIPRFME